MIWVFEWLTLTQGFTDENRLVQDKKNWESHDRTDSDQGQEKFKFRAPDKDQHKLCYVIFNISDQYEPVGPQVDGP